MTFKDQNKQADYSAAHRKRVRNVRNVVVVTYCQGMSSSPCFSSMFLAEIILINHTA